MSWQSKTCDVKEKLEYVKNFKELSDVTISVGQKSFQTHSLILSMYSERFCDMFKAKKHSKITLTDVNADIFDIFLDYIYSDVLSINSTAEVLSVLMFADNYKVPQLRTKCVNYLAGALPPDIVTDIFEASTSSQSSRNEDRPSGDKSPPIKIVNREENNIPVDNDLANSLEMEIEQSGESTENVSQTRPDFNRSYSNPISGDSFENTQVRYCRHKRIIDLSNILKEVGGKDESFEKFLEFVSTGNWNSEIEMKGALQNWGRRQFEKQCIPADLIEKLYIIVEQMNELKEKRFQETYRETPNINRSHSLYSKCTKNWISSSNFPYVKETFRSKDFDLFVNGVSLTLKYISNVSCKNLSVKINLKIRNVTRNTNANKEISISPDGSDRAIPLKLLHPVYVRKGEICEIVVESETKLINGEFVYCGETCCLDHRLEKVYTECNEGGHFNAIIVLFPSL